MSGQVAVAREQETLLRCSRCGGGPLIGPEVKRGTCANCVGAPPRVFTRCRLCGVILGLDDDTKNGLCLDHATRPEAKRLLAGDQKAPSPPPGAPGYTGPPQRKPDPPPAPPPKRAARAFTAADRSLIKHVGSYMPRADLLRVLNERLVADVGDAAVLYTPEQLHEALQELVDTKEPTGTWTSLRRVLAQARRSGLLAQITPERIEDFAVVFQLAPAQLVALKDVVRHAQEER